MTAALGELDLLGWVSAYAVVLLRTSGIVVFLPIFSTQLVPGRVRVALALALAVVLLPLLAVQLPAPTGAGEWLVVAVRELAAGLGLGLAARVMFAGIESASSLVAGQSGLSLANMLDPLTGEQVLAPALFQNMLAIALFLAADLHHLFILAVRHSYEVLPPAIALPDFGGMGEAVGVLGGRLFAIAVELAAPALLVTFSMDLLLGLVGRAMTQVPILLVGYPVKMAAGLIALAILAASTGSAMGWIGRTIASDGMAIFAALSGNR